MCFDVRHTRCLQVNGQWRWYKGTLGNRDWKPGCARQHQCRWYSIIRSAMARKRQPWNGSRGRSANIHADHGGPGRVAGTSSSSEVVVETLRRATHLRSGCIKAVAFHVIALDLSACSSPSAGVLTQADIPIYLGLKLNPSAAAIEGRSFGSDPHCKKTGDAILTLPGWRAPTGTSPQSASRPVVVSVDDSCTTTADAHQAFKSDASLAGRAIAGIGDEATLLRLGAGQRVYGVGWREGNQIGVVLVIGTTGDKHITQALATSLARRAVARS
jgi:hypothetical protein